MKPNSKPHASATETQPGTKRNYPLEMKQGQMNRRAKLQRSSIKRENPIHEATEVDPNEFGLLFTVMEKITDQQMYHIIQNKWKPTKEFDFPWESYMKGTMGEERLNGLVALHAHRHLKLDSKQLINNFSTMHPRQMMMTSIFND